MSVSAQKALLLTVLVITMCSTAASELLDGKITSLLPANTSQIVSISTRALRGSSTADAMKRSVIPEEYRQLEEHLSQLGIDPEQVDQLTFALLPMRSGEDLLVVIARGGFRQKNILAHFRHTKTDRKQDGPKIYAIVGGQAFYFIDANTIAVGGNSALEQLKQVRRGARDSLDRNADSLSYIQAVAGPDIWSVLDERATRNMLRFGLNNTVPILDFKLIDRRVLGCYYSLDLSSGLKMELTIVSSDSVTASAVSALIQAYFVYQRLTGKAPDFDSTDISTASDKTIVRVSVGKSNLQKFLRSELFIAISR